MKFTFDKIETFGAGVTAYRINPEREADSAYEVESLRTNVPRTEKAKRLGNRLREQFVRKTR
ncbi:MAG: hypothetical protein DMF93_14775 [Acidobacteria bacterium]|nr:MAG: hypothetical protein DMF93_14775 [Acidobacteriota bacterium]